MAVDEGLVADGLVVLVDLQRALHHHGVELCEARALVPAVTVVEVHVGKKQERKQQRVRSRVDLPHESWENFTMR
jgi:hypothetical protein